MFFKKKVINSEGMRVDALLARYGYCTRRGAPALLRDGRVRKRDGTSVTVPGQQVNVAEVLIDGVEVPFPQGICVALHKPLGYVCSHAEEEGGKPVFKLLPAEWARRNPCVQCVGRLDKNTTGLLLLSDDGNFVHGLTSPRRHVKKVYSFETSEPISEDAVALFASGKFMLKGEKTPCLPAKLERTDSTHGKITLEEGRYHQVRRMLAAVGAPVTKLHRESFGPLRLSALKLAPGKWCSIDPSAFCHHEEK